MSTPSPDYYLLGGHFDISSQIKQEAPPYLPDPLLPAYNLKPQMAYERRPPAFDTETQNTFGAGPGDASLRGFDLAESIWSQDSDLTLDDLALHSDSASRRSRSSASSHWSAAPLTPLTTPHRQLPPTQEPPPLQESVPTPVDPTSPASESVPEHPDSPAPAYSRDPLEFDPALLASLDPQLRDRPFEALEDAFWACFADSPPAHDGPYTFSPLNASVSQLHLAPIQTSFTAHTSFSQSSMATTLVSSLPPLPPPPPPPPAYPTSKPLPNLPPPSPRSSAGHTQPPRTPVVMSFNSFVTLDDPPYPASPPSDTVQFFPLRAPVRPRSKSVGGTKPVRRLTGAIARLRGRE
ncbi:hypothetical protein EI94DRAFT_1698393 [Lactarius quietus]|nr:hypothetical protein EI94DRAFT_1698393 [Lactarius quietus]